MKFGLLDFEFYTGAALALGLGLFLLALKPPERSSIRNMLVLLGILVVFHVGAQFVAPRNALLLGGVAAVGLGAVLIRLGTILLFRIIFPKLHFRLPRIAEDLFTAALVIAWGLFWLHGAGLNLASLLTTSAVITAVLAFSMQDTLGNILGGVVLQLDDSLRVGDWVKIDDVSGRVVDVRWRHTAIETRDRETVIIPNGWLVKNRFSVIGSRNEARVRWRRRVWINLDLSTPPGQVCEILEDSIRTFGVANVLQEPPPNAVLSEVAQGFGRYSLRYWVSDPAPDELSDSLVLINALAALARHNLYPAVVQEQRLLVKEDAERDAAKLASEIARRRAALEHVDLFRTLDEAERERLATAFVNAFFVKGSTITRQGSEADWLYLMASGEADIWAEKAHGRVHITTLKAGQVFGEMGMMTGEPRRATVTAKTDVECFRLDKRGFESVLRARPEIAGEVSMVIAARRGQLDSLQAAADGAVHTDPHDALRARIRSFFGLDAP